MPPSKHVFENTSVWFLFRNHNNEPVSFFLQLPVAVRALLSGCAHLQWSHLPLCFGQLLHGHVHGPRHLPKRWGRRYLCRLLTGQCPWTLISLYRMQNQWRAATRAVWHARPHRTVSRGEHEWNLIPRSVASLWSKNSFVGSKTIDNDTSFNCRLMKPH